MLDKISESRALERRDFDHWMDEYNTIKNTLETKRD